MHYQIYLKGSKEFCLVDADSMEHVGNMLVLYKANTAVAAISLSELKCVIEVEASSVPPKDVFLDQQTELQKLRVEHKALQFKNNELWEERRTALDAQSDNWDALQAEKKSHKQTNTMLGIVLAVDLSIAAYHYFF